MQDKQDSRPAPLAGLTIVEISAFVAAPLGGMTLAQLGADVIRIDPIGGNIDHSRWPITEDGNSIYWASLNKGKKSVTLDFKSEEGQAIAAEIIASAGTLITNLPARGWLSYENLSKQRPDLVMLRLTGTHDGSPAVDYTVNASSGFPCRHRASTGSRSIMLYQHGTLLLASTSPQGSSALSLNVASPAKARRLTLRSPMSCLRRLATSAMSPRSRVNGSTRGPLGNALYGAYGQSFQTSDEREVMVVAISNRQWRSLGDATGLAEKLAMIGPLLDVDLNSEGGRYEAREAIDAVLRPWFAKRTASEVTKLLADAGVLQGVFQTFEQLVNEDPELHNGQPAFY
jgi:2-methylfumaryl-CoA isomerase